MINLLVYCLDDYFLVTEERNVSKDSSPKHRRIDRRCMGGESCCSLKLSKTKYPKDKVSEDINTHSVNCMHTMKSQLNPIIHYQMKGY